MSELEIIKVMASRIDRRLFPFQIPRAFFYGWECDYWTLDAKGMTREFEIKISRADYAIDAKKEKHKDYSKGANYFYYVCPKDLIKKEEVDSKYGLVYVDGNQMYFVKTPKKLHKNEFDQWKILANKMYWKWWNLWKDKFDSGQIGIDEYLSNQLLTFDELTEH